VEENAPGRLNSTGLDRTFPNQTRTLGRKAGVADLSIVIHNRSDGHEPNYSEVALLTGVDQAKPRPAAALRPRYVSIDDVCRYMGVGRSKFYRDFLRRLRTLRIGKRNLVELDSVDQLLDQLRAEQ